MRERARYSKRDEEYLEAMLILLRDKGVIRVKDIAKTLGIKPSSVVSFLEKLAEKGLVEYRKYDFIRLTKKGKEIAERVYQRHKIIKDFLIEVLNVPENIAEKDACYIEHGLHEETLNRMIQLLKVIRENRQIKEIILRELSSTYK